MTAGRGPTIEFRVLGPFEVVSGGESLALGGPKQRALLAALVIEANRVVSVDRLVEELWGDEAPSRAMASLQAYVSRLRRLLQPAGPRRSRADVLVTQAPGYVLRVEPASVDAVRFERGATAGIDLLASNDAAGALEVLEAALPLWRGAPYSDFGFEEFAQAEIARLTELWLAATEARLAALVETGHAATAVADAEALLRDHPLREGVWASLMTGLYRLGRQGDALRAYQRAREVIGEELGLEPGPALQQLEARILSQSADLEPDRERSIPGLVTPATSPAPAVPEPAEDALVGRSPELRLLREAVAGATGGRGRAVILHGEPGIGKTRLAREAARLGAEARAVVGQGNGVEGQITAAYWPWTHLLRGLLDGFGRGELPFRVREALAELAHLDPALGHHAGEVTAPPPPLDPELARGRLQRAVVDVVLGLAASGPVVIVLEDLQWADQSSLQLLSLLAGELADAPVLVVTTYRQHEAGPTLSTALGALARVPGTVDLRLGGLDPESVHRFVELTAGHEVSQAVATSIASRTSGNPLFVGELTRLLRSERTLHEDAVRQAPVPAGVREVIRRRLERLPAQTTTVLTVAAVIGRRFPVHLLEEVTQLPEDELFDRVESAIATGLVVEAEGSVGIFGFTHDLVRDTLQDGVSGTRKARLHARVAEALLEHGDEHDPARPFEVAHHLLAALPLVPAEEVAARVLAAADAAAARLAFDQAEVELRHALGLVDLLPAEARAGHELAVRVRLARVLTLSRGHASPEEREHAARAVELAGEVQPSPDVILALWGAAVSAGMAAEFSTTLAIGRKLLAWADEGADAAVRYMGHALIGGSAWYVGDLGLAATNLRLAIEILDAGGLDPRLFHDRTYGVWSRAAHALVAWLGGDDREAQALMADALRRAEEPGRVFGLVFALFLDAFLALFRGDRDHARRRGREVTERADAIGYRQFSALGRTLTAAAHDDPAARAVELESSPWKSSGPPLFQPYFLALQAEAELELRRPARAATVLGDALKAVEATGERFYEPEIHRLLGVAALQQRQVEAALAHSERGIEVARHLGLGALERRAVASLDALRGAAYR